MTGAPTARPAAHDRPVTTSTTTRRSGRAGAPVRTGAPRAIGEPTPTLLREAERERSFVVKDFRRIGVVVAVMAALLVISDVAVNALLPPRPHPLEPDADPTVGDERLEVIVVERAAARGARELRWQGQLQRRVVHRAVVRDAVHRGIAHADHVAAALEHADPRRQIVRVIGGQVEPGERPRVIERAAQLDGRGVRDHNGLWRVGRVTLLHEAHGVASVASMQLALEAPHLALGDERVLGMLAHLLLDLDQLRSEAGDIVHRPLELLDDGVRACLGFRGDLRANACGGGEACLAVLDPRLAVDGEGERDDEAESEQPGNERVDDRREPCVARLLGVWLRGGEAQRARLFRATVLTMCSPKAQRAGHRTLPVMCECNHVVTRCARPHAVG